MNFIIKIVEGPNRGAEIALPEGVAVTLGKSDACDVVLADSTLPDEPLTFAAAASRVTVGGETLEPFPGVGDGQGGLACYDSWGRKQLDTTERPICSDLI